jgi:hypothetical protein
MGACVEPHRSVVSFQFAIWFAVRMANRWPSNPVARRCSGAQGPSVAPAGEKFPKEFGCFRLNGFTLAIRWWREARRNRVVQCGNGKKEGAPFAYRRAERQGEDG